MPKSPIPAVIVGYNQLSYIKRMVAQLEKYVEHIIIVDNNSTYQPLLEYYEHDYKHTLLRQKINPGSSALQTSKQVQELTGDIYLITDPDILLNPNLPDNFIEILLEISEHFQAYSVGFALDIWRDDIRQDHQITVYGKNYTIVEWEQQFWKARIPYKAYELYAAQIDTTFSIKNRKYFRKRGGCIRIAGNFTATHMPWLTNYKQTIDKDELEYYMTLSSRTNWFR